MKAINWLLTSLLLIVLLSSCTSLSQPSLSEEEALFQEILQSNGQIASDGRNCSKILETEPWCSVVLTVTNVTRPEWTSLFPATKFFLVERNVLGQEAGFQSNWLIAKQNQQQFTVETFDQLLTTNGITITDTNREQVAKAVVLMSLPDYVEQDIVFSEWSKGDWPAGFGDRFSHSIRVWTRIQGLKMTYFFAFENGNLWEVDRGINIEPHVGNYANVPFERLRIPGFKSYFFGRNVN